MYHVTYQWGVCASRLPTLRSGSDAIPGRVEAGTTPGTDRGGDVRFGSKTCGYIYFFMRACVRVCVYVYVYAISRFAFDSEHAKTPQPYSAGELRSPRISSSRRSWQRSHR